MERSRRESDGETCGACLRTKKGTRKKMCVQRVFCVNQRGPTRVGVKYSYALPYASRSASLRVSQRRKQNTECTSYVCVCVCVCV